MDIVRLTNYTLKEEPVGFADELKVEYERRAVSKEFEVLA